MTDSSTAVERHADIRAAQIVALEDTERGDHRAATGARGPRARGGGTVSSLAAHTGAGAPLSAESRRFFEPAMGAALGDVRIHSNGAAHTLAAHLRAAAFTIGRDIYFAAGRYRPETRTGRRLLAHELAHVLHHRHGPAGTLLTVYRKPVGELAGGRYRITSNLSVYADEELVPFGEGAGRFEGYATPEDAMQLARRSAEAVVVLEDPDGRFHVLPVPDTPSTRSAAGFMDPAGWRVVHHGEAKPRSDPVDLETLDGHRTWLSNITHLTRDQTASAATREDAVPGKVNVGTWVNSLAGGVTLPPRIEPTGNAPLPPPAIGMRTWRSPPADTTDVRGTLLHEQRHAYHTARAIELILQWRAQRSTDSIGAWGAWLKAQHASGRISQEEFITTWGKTHTGRDANATTETYAHLHAFLYRFRRLPLAGSDPTHLAERYRHLRAAERSTWPNDLGQAAEHGDASSEQTQGEREKNLRQAEITLAIGMDDLREFAQYWTESDKTTKDETLAFLVESLNQLSPSHRLNVHWFIAYQRRNKGIPDDFYKKLEALLPR